MSPGTLALDPFFGELADDERWLASEGGPEDPPVGFFARLILRTFLPSGLVMIST